MLHPQGIRGLWKAGIVLDWHTIDSKITGENEFGHPIFENQRSEIGELLFRFKYRGDQSALNGIVQACVHYLSQRARGKFDLMLPIPPSIPSRTVTSQIAQGIAAGHGCGFSDSALRKIRPTTEVKSIADLELRKAMLREVYLVDSAQTSGKSVLLLDDLYRSGATLEAATEAVLGQGGPAEVYVLAITRTRVHK